MKFFSMSFLSVQVIHPYSNTDAAKASKKSGFILSERSGFSMIDYLSIAVYTFAMLMLTQLSIDELLLPSYVSLTTNLGGLPLNVETALSYLKLINCFISVHVKANASNYLLLGMQQRFSLRLCIWDKRQIICAVWVWHSFCGKSSASCLFTWNNFLWLGLLNLVVCDLNWS